MGHQGALHGVRVLDLADEAGVYCTKLLADMGADVIKVEPPGGVRMRQIGPFYGGAAHPDRSIFYWHYNTNKRCVVLDLGAPGDRRRFMTLAQTADLLVETGAPGQLDALGIGYHELAAHHTGLTLVSITPFGQSGPSRNCQGSDLIGQAAGGMVYVNGFAAEPPLQGLGLQAYHSASTYAAIAALLALLARRRTGRGQWIDVSVQECVAACVEHASSFFHQDGTIAERQGSLHWTRYFRVGRCTDGYVLHCTLGDWTSLIEWIKADGKAQDLENPSWDDVDYRRSHCEHLFDVLDEWACNYTVGELVDGAQLRRIPYAAVLGPDALLRNPQLRERHFFVPVVHDELGETLTYPGAPYGLSGSPWRITRRPPLLGEHNDEGFADIGAGSTAAHSGTDTEGGPAPAGRAHRALDGIRIIDFTWVVAGPVATRILADHGAEVIKIERRDALDFGSRRGGLSGNLNRGKQSVVLNMNDPRGIDLAKRLIASADVVIDNFSARVMRNWGLDYDRLRGIKPDIIAVSMSGFGQSGPQRDYVSYGPTLQALSGYTLLMRHAGETPAGWGFSYSDMAGGYSGALAVLLALWHRHRTGQGQSIDLSQFENLTALLGPGLLSLLVHPDAEAPFARPIDNRSQEMPSAPHGVYRCADRPGDGPARDRWCAIAVFGEAQWQRFCTALGRPTWMRHEHFATEKDRLLHPTELDGYIASWARTRSAETVMTVLQEAGVPASVVATAEDLCRTDSHLRARHYWARVRTPEGNTVELDGVPFKMSDTPGRVTAPGPLLGEHTDAVLRRVLGLNADAIATLRDADVIA